MYRECFLIDIMTQIKQSIKRQSSDLLSALGHYILALYVSLSRISYHEMQRANYIVKLVNLLANYALNCLLHSIQLLSAFSYSVAASQQQVGSAFETSCQSYFRVICQVATPSCYV